MLNNGAKWYNFSPPRWSFIAPPLTGSVFSRKSDPEKMLRVRIYRLQHRN